MRAREAAERLGISQRALRHYESVGLLAPARDANGYRRYDETDLRRATRVRDLIAVGYSTREILAMAPCLEDAGAGPCAGGIASMRHKLRQIDRLLAELAARRLDVLERIAMFETSLATDNAASGSPDDDDKASATVLDRVPDRRRRVPSRPDPHADRR